MSQTDTADNLSRDTNSGPKIDCILVPLDGSAASEQAIPYAAAIAHRKGARLAFVHVHEPHDAAEGVEEAYPASLVSDESLGGLEVRADVLHGPVHESLLAHAADTRADLIVMTSSGRGGLRRALFGSVADALVRRAEIPVLLVRPEVGPPPDPRRMQARGLTRVLLPLDGSELAESIIPHALALTGTEGVHYVLLRVHPALTPEGFIEPGPILGQGLPPGGDGYLSTMAARMSERGALTSTRAVVHASNAEAILNVAAEEKVDLIAMTTRGAGGADRMLFGSVADVVLRRAPAHVLVFRPPGPGVPRESGSHA